MAGFSTETVTVIRPPARDRFGDQGAGTVVEFDIGGCLFAPGPSRETGFATQQVQSDGTVYGPPGMDVLATDRMRIRGDVYVVVGKPQVWGTTGTVVVLRLFTG